MHSKSDIADAASAASIFRTGSLGRKRQSEGAHYRSWAPFFVSMSDRSKGNIALLMTAVLWGTGFIAQKLGNTVMPPMTFNAVRQIMAGIVLTPLVLHGLRKSGYLTVSEDSDRFSDENADSNAAENSCRADTEKTNNGIAGNAERPEVCDEERPAPGNTAEEVAYRKKRLLQAGALCGLFMLIGTTTQQIGLLTVSAGKSGFISSVYIVIVPFFSVLLGNKVRARSVICVIIAMIGFAIMSLEGGFGGATAGDWLTLISAAGFAAQIVAINQFVDKDNAIIISQLQFLFGGIAGLLIAIIAESPAPSSLLAGIPILLYSTFVPTAGGYTLQIIGQKYTDSSTASLLMSTESVFAAIFGALFLGEMMSLREIAGSAVIFAAIILGQTGQEGAPSAAQRDQRSEK